VNTSIERSTSKVPEITLIFWIIKIAATTLRETGGDAVSMSMNLATIIATTVGTTLADFADRSLGIGYAGGASLLFALLLASLAMWYRTLGSVSVVSVSSAPAELFYWVTIADPGHRPGGLGGRQRRARLHRWGGVVQRAAGAGRRGVRLDEGIAHCACVMFSRQRPARGGHGQPGDG